MKAKIFLAKLVHKIFLTLELIILIGIILLILRVVADAFESVNEATSVFLDFVSSDKNFIYFCIFISCLFFLLVWSNKILLENTQKGYDSLLKKIYKKIYLKLFENEGYDDYY